MNERETGDAHGHEMLNRLRERGIDVEQVGFLIRGIVILVDRVEVNLLVRKRVERYESRVQPAHVQAESRESRNQRRSNVRAEYSLSEGAAQCSAGLRWPPITRHDGRPNDTDDD